MPVGFKKMGVACIRPDRMPSSSLRLLFRSPHLGDRKETPSKYNLHNWRGCTENQITYLWPQEQLAARKRLEP